ncbi:hypothetical protein BH24DEI1_BH24DEI1_04070 [soil metagenome]|jgi:hypothetical protein|nr:hypothetical protein [Deinococcota bacterium]
MTQQLQDILQAAHALSPEEKRKLLEVLSHEVLSHKVEPHPLEKEAAVFWASSSLEALIEQQKVQVVTDVRSLAVDFWPEDESADEFNRFIAKRRRSERMSAA